jgi:hypothetical protein
MPTHAEVFLRSASVFVADVSFAHITGQDENFIRRMEKSGLTPSHDSSPAVGSCLLVRCFARVADSEAHRERQGNSSLYSESGGPEEYFLSGSKRSISS